MEKTIHVEEYRALLKWLHDARKRRGMSLRELAERVGVHHSRIGRIETGERRLDLLEFVRFCQEIGCDPGKGLDLVANALRQKELAAVAEARATYETQLSKNRPKSPKRRRK